MIKVVICDGAGSIELPKPSPEMYELLDDLPRLGIELAVASNDLRSRIERRFRQADLDIPGIIVTSQDIGIRKPSPNFVYAIQDATGVGLNEMVYLGDDDKTDIFCAINAQVLPFAARYSQSGKAMNYGIPVCQPKAFHQYLATFGTQDAPYFGWNYNGRCADTGKPIHVHVLFGDHGSLGLTHLLKRVLKDQQSTPVGRFQIELATILFQYFVSQLYLSGMTHDVDWITIYPSHREDRTNPLLEEFSTYLTQSFRQKFVPDLLIRHTDAQKSQRTPGDRRSIYNQFQTIMVNDEYQRKLDRGDKTVLVLDDFTTSGCSLETARRMLLQAGVQQVIGVAIAKYRQTYTVSHITQTWNPYKPCDLFEGDIQVSNIYGSGNPVADHYFGNIIWPQYGR